MKNFFIIVGLLGLGIGIGWFISDYQVRQARPCVAEEARIRKEFADITSSARAELGAEQADWIEKMSNVRMYADLAEQGCPEHQQNYRERHDALRRELNRGSFVARTGAEIRIDMDRVADTVNEVTREAVNVIGDVVDRIRDTRISITVE